MKAVRWSRYVSAGAAVLLAAAPVCRAGAAAPKVETFGKMPDGREVKMFTLANKKGLTAKVTEYGAILVSMQVPDREGKLADVTHGYDTLEGWLGNTSYFGSTAGRFANRIANGKFTLDGREYTLATNNAPGNIPCALHGGKVGFDKVLWKGEPVTVDGATGVCFTRVSPDGEEGYPGNLTSKVTYLLTPKNELKVLFEATTDKPTVINLCHHSYWNLTGDPSKTILDHELTLKASRYLPTDAGLIPTGKLAPVKGTPMDFTKPHKIGERIGADFEALKFGGGYDHCWVLNGEAGKVRLASDLFDPSTGRGMRILTDQAGIQFYAGNFLDGTTVGKGGVKYQYRTALCLETERFPDAPNHPDFPTAVLRPGETYKHTMIHQFYVKK
jgi:aldose 1-epimerase